jgi:hypothetical protein
VIVSINLPLVFRDHAPSTLETLDSEVQRLSHRIAELAQRRAIIETHLTLQKALELAMSPARGS